MRSAGKNKFPKDIRLRTSDEFRKVYDGGRKFGSQSFTAFRISNGLDYSRFGLTTSRKLGKAHDRNRVKRRIKEIVRTSYGRFPSGFDVVLNPRRSSGERDLEALRGELINLLGGV